MKFTRMTQRLALTAMSLAAVGCEPGGVAGQLVPNAPTYAQAMGADGACNSRDRYAAPYVVDARPEQRMAIEVAMNGGIAVVAYDCQQLRVIADCRIDGEYGFMGTSPKEQLVRLQSADEVSLNLPLSALGAPGTASGGLERGATLDVALKMIGKRMSTRTFAPRASLTGDCAGATHFVRGATVGAFAVATGTRARVRTALEVFGIGASGASEQAKTVRNQDGSPEACDAFDLTAASPPSKCAALVQLDLTAIDDERPDPEIPEFARSTCPVGTVLAAGRCTRTAEEEPHRCRIGNVRECDAQCNAGDAGSCTILGDMLFRSKWEMRDDAGAVAAFDRACKLGDPHGCNGLGVAYLDGKGIGKDERKGVELLRRACEGGSARGCTSLGYAFTYGKGVAKDEQRAVGHFDQACRGGLGRACANLGVMLLEGTGVAKDVPRAVDLLERACVGQDASGCYNLARLLAHGTGVGKDLARAVGLYQQACEDGEAFSCNNLGTLYVTGNGVSKDMKRAARAFERACNGSPGGCTNLGVLVRAGQGAPRNPARAVELFRKACSGADARGCGELGVMLAEGNGVAQDIPEARKVLDKACAAGESSACTKLRELK